VFTLQEREERKTFTFLSYESCTIRKGTKELLKAFKEEFTGEDNVKLILKTVEGSHNHKVEINEKNVEVIDAIYTHQQLLELLQRADCFVFPSMGEGWGTPPLEAMATGIPAIVTNHGGIRDYFGGPGMLAVDTIETPHCYWHLKHEGLDDEVIMVKANIQSLRRQMRNAYEYREMYHDNAQEISRYAQQYPIEKTIRNLRNIMASEVGK
jgi:glycosyltransferase involved in cell wall biosynthesis